jgi:hypothetical protein
MATGLTRSNQPVTADAGWPHVSPVLVDVLDAACVGIAVMSYIPSPRHGKISGPKTVLPLSIYDNQKDAVGIVEGIGHDNLVS